MLLDCIVEHVSLTRSHFMLVFPYSYQNLLNIHHDLREANSSGKGLYLTSWNWALGHVDRGVAPHELTLSL